ncbi:MAG: hypothetical protein LBJ72_06720 [Dysgonamonadaceae bacterium]|jgi:hypothetical protein|nr:hypothetical protein [Dysgonamonadaceae bacterium]
MKIKMRALLEKYWNCETTPEEEQMLREWFEGDDVPEDLKKYRNNFLHLTNFKKTKAPASISRKALSQLPSIQFYPALRVAASILIILFAGTGIYTHYQQEEFLKEIFSETYSDPQDAIKETQAVLDKVSSSLLRAKDSIGVLQEDSVIPEEVIKDEVIKAGERIIQEEE